MINEVVIGKDLETNEDISLKLKELTRYFSCFGTIGSGKTVACKVLIQELALIGVPSIIIDTKGDLSTMAELASDSILEQYGTEISHKERFAENVDVTIWTPGRKLGIPLSISPLQFNGIKELTDIDKENKLMDIADKLLNLTRYELDTDEREKVQITLSKIFSYCIDNNIQISNVDDIIYCLEKPPKILRENLQNIVTIENLNRLKDRLYLLTQGASNQLLNVGYPLDIDLLLGTNSDSNKTRISVIYMKTMNKKERQESFLSLLFSRLKQWGEQNRVDTEKDEILKCAVFIDESHLFLPPSNVKHPLCRADIIKGIKIFRSYGISLVMATQNIGDVDYKAFGNFGSKNFGKLTAKQDLNKIKHLLEAENDELKANTQHIIPTLETGKFLLITPTGKEIKHYKVGGLVTWHGPNMEDSDIKKFTTNSIKKKIKDEAKSYDAKIDDNVVSKEKNEIINKVENKDKHSQIEVVSINDILAIQIKQNNSFRFLIYPIIIAVVLIELLTII